jgi:hypothetical protein
MGLQRSFSEKGGSVDDTTKLPTNRSIRPKFSTNPPLPASPASSFTCAHWIYSPIYEFERRRQPNRGISKLVAERWSEDEAPDDHQNNQVNRVQRASASTPTSKVHGRAATAPDPPWEMRWYADLKQRTAHDKMPTELKRQDSAKAVQQQEGSPPDLPPRVLQSPATASRRVKVRFKPYPTVVTFIESLPPTSWAGSAVGYDP